MRKLGNLFLILLPLLILSGCKEDSEHAKALTAIHVVPEEVNLETGNFRYIKAEPVPSDADKNEMPFIWESHNTGIATVSQTGTIKAVSPGTTEITVSARINTKINKKIAVTVSQPSFRISIGSTVYNVDTLDYREISKGVKWLKFKIPEFVNGFNTFGKGLVANTLEIDITHPGNKMEVCPASQATWGNVETPTAMYSRKQEEYSTKGTRPIAVINGDFYLLSGGNNTGYAYINNRPIGAEVSNGMVV